MEEAKLASIVLAAIAITIYVIVILSRGYWPNLSLAFQAGLAGASLPAGAFLMRYCDDMASLAQLELIWLYNFLGGGCVIFVSVAGVFNLLTAKHQQR